MNINPDSFSSGQITSKLWLCQELEKHFDSIDSMWLYGGWYGITAFLLFSRERISIKQIHSFDIDPRCRQNADHINENWVWRNWQFKAFTMDCNYLEPYVYHPNCIINTATEHFDNDRWFYNIPAGTIVVLQGNNMPHNEHSNCIESLKEFEKKYPITNTLYSGQKDFFYPEWSFSRYMVIGYK